MTDSPFEVSDDGSVTITLKADGDHKAPWMVLRYDSVEKALEAFAKEDGAHLMKLMREVSGASKAFNATYNNKEIPEARTQGKPQGADTPSPEKGQDPFSPTPVDDAPPFATTAPSVPSCKHGEMEKRVHKGVTGYICPSGLPKDDPGRCASVMV
jgi:hypothetical protein